ncbi:MAG TPA: Crp/Fnr family transcriptional regulator [Polyangia bacterium]|nr:Crp/Fnr family transcriptional regulator [Polyangia bacterium]
MPAVDVAVLRMIPLFRGLDAPALKALAGLARQRRCGPGEDIVQQDTAADAVYLIVRGRASVSTIGRNGEPLVIREIGAGEIIGEVSLLDGGLRSATVKALTKTDLVGIDRAPFVQLIGDRPAIALSLLGVLATRLRLLTTYADDLAGLSLRARLAKYLFTLSTVHGQPVGPTRVRIGQKFSQEELARRLGVTRESVNKHLRQLQKDGIVVRESGHLVVMAPAKLKAAAAGD